ncbi:NAD(P)H-hydrate dehydratase [Marinicella meishanensis]|uniref:NAD(P)H-hydrate dehydratase n=1 Tax=Marinicella meishanensis TaxID=2873263 RepID=UPI001CBEF659|nr:NAD(P)H-hydrate dehydratase [Marinicella sp. NBU2979]
MTPLYSNDKTQTIDQLAAQALGVNSFELMQRAAAAVYAHLTTCKRLLVFTGPGNNGGDGWVIAEMARQQGQAVLLVAMRPPAELAGDARLAAEHYQGEHITFEAFQKGVNFPHDVLVDAVFGTGLNQAVRGAYQAVINWINQQSQPVLAVDIPSGLNGTTGQIEGVAVQADHTVSILARNTGLYTLDGKACCGTIHFADLAVAPAALSSVPVSAELLPAHVLQQVVQRRPANSHKGHFGHVLVAGGQAGMLGAVLLAGQAVLRSGAGLCTVVTDPEHANWIPLQTPELMSQAFDGTDGEGAFWSLLERKPPQVLLLGMGLGLSQWSKQVYQMVTRSEVPLVVDADGLTLLAAAARVPEHLAVITPHPKEAAVLLGSTVAEVQADRWQAVQALAERYQCVAVLKGSGSLICDGQTTWCCPFGNANLATAGSGDVLGGLVAGLLAQGHAPAPAACLAVTWHALAGERSAQGLCLTASDLLAELHRVLP